MNSRQRRVDKRRWKHRIHVKAKNFDHYKEMWNWLDARHGRKGNKCGWREGEWNYVNGVSDRIYTNWQFVCEKNALAFALAWAGD